MFWDNSFLPGKLNTKTSSGKSTFKLILPTKSDTKKEEEDDTAGNVKELPNKSNDYHGKSRQEISTVVCRQSKARASVGFSR